MPEHLARHDQRGKLNGATVEVPDAEARRILAAACPEPDRITGLGDVVAIVAQPLAKAADAILGTNLRNCGRRRARQKKL